MRKKSKSKSPLGDGLFTRDPYAPDEDEEEDFEDKESSKKASDSSDDSEVPIEKVAKRALAAAKERWTILVILAGVIALFIGGWGGFAVGFVLLSFALFMSLRKDKKAQKYVESNLLWLLPSLLVALVALPVLGPMSCAYYGKLRKMDWEERANPPAICYFWIVDLDKFSSNQKTTLARWNPGVEENQLIREALHGGAIVADIHVDQVVRYRKSKRDMLNCRALVVFQGIVAEGEAPSAEPLEGGEGGGNSEAPVAGRARLLVHFKVIKTGSIAFVTQPDGGVSIEKGNFEPVNMLAPESLQIDFRFFADGLGKARNKEVNFDQIPNFIQERMKEAEEQRKSLQDGPGTEI